MNGAAGWLLEHAFELLTGLVLLVLGTAFRSWSRSLETSSEKVVAAQERQTKAMADAHAKIIEKIDALRADFHEHELSTERRVSRVEAQLHALERRNNVGN